MKYIKAQTVFPKSLLDEIQKYVQGELIYIPKSPDNYIEWGSNSGAKDLIARRNKEMARAFKSGTTIPSLAKFYNLSEDTVKKIVYRKN